MLDLKESKIDPSLQKVADANEDSVNNDMPSSIPSFRAFRLPDGNAGAECTDTEADYETSDHELWELEACTLQNLSYESTDPGQEGCLPSTE